jgi:hypothetical protein
MFVFDRLSLFASAFNKSLALCHPIWLELLSLTRDFHLV